MSNSVANRLSREALRSRHYSRRTEEAFLVYHRGTHPQELAESDVNRFLTHLAVGENVAASTQNQLNRKEHNDRHPR